MKGHRALARFMLNIRARAGEEVQTTLPDCMYWAKHHEAALIVGALVRMSRNPEFDSVTRGWYRSTARKIAAQWNKYDKLAGTDNSDSPDSQKPQEGQN